MSIQNTFVLDVDFKRKNYMNEPIVTQNDDVTFILNVYDDEVEYDLSTVTTCTLASFRADGQSVMSLGTETGTNQITFTLGSTELEVVGRVKAAIQIYDIDGRVSTLPFTYQVIKDLIQDYVPSENEKTLIELVLGEAPAILQAAKDATVSANTAATNANEAITNVNDAITNTNNAATNANEKANLADAAATNANEKAMLADIGATNANNAKDAAIQATTNAETATLDAINATNATNQAITDAQAMANQLGFVDTYSGATQYKKNNVVEFNGSSFIALKDSVGQALPVLPAKSNTYWSLVAQRGVDGSGSVSSVNGVSPDVNGNVTLDTATGTVKSVNNVQPDSNGNVEIELNTDVATTSTNGLMSSADKTKLAGIETGAQVNTITSVNGATGDITGLATEISVSNQTGILLDNIGDMTALETANTTDLVKAINEINAKPTGDVGTAEKINSLYRQNAAQDREIAHLKLKQDASDRVDGGTVFAHDMNGNIIGMTLDEANSQNIVIRDGKMLLLEKSEVAKNVTDATVVASVYDTSGNGGRKLVRLKDGTLFTVTKDASLNVRLYRSINNGVSWTAAFNTSGSNLVDAALTTDGNYVFFMYAYGTSSVSVRTIKSDGTLSHTTASIETGQTALGNVSLAINPEGTELHATWASKNATYPNSFNIRYAKGVISQVDGSVTWGTVVQVTTQNTTGTNLNNPTIVVKSNGYPSIICGAVFGSPYNQIIVYNWGGSSFGAVVLVYDGATYVQSSPSAIFVPKSVNGLANGRIWVAWHGYDATNASRNNIRVSFSDDGGVTWSTMVKVTSGNSDEHRYPSITVSKDNRVFIVWEWLNGSLELRTSEYVGGTWSTPTKIGTASGVSSPSTLSDTSISFSSPLFIYKNTTSNKIGFYGTWQEPVETPSLTAKAVYDIPSTDYVGAFVQKIGATTVKAYVNDVLTDAELVDNEYGFTKQLDAEVPVKLRLELSRATIDGGESDAIVRVLGGRS